MTHVSGFPATLSSLLSSNWIKMRKLIHTVFLILFISASCLSQTTETAFQTPANLSEAIAQSSVIIQELLSEYPGLSIAVGIDDSVVWSKGFGFADVAEKRAMQADHQLRYYSLSKSITGMALIKFIESGSLDIEESVKRYLPDLPEHYQDIKIKHLIAHTSGIRAYNKGEWMKLSKNHCNAPAEALDVFINDPLQSKPGESYSYSSFGYVLISKVIEAISGKTYFDFLQEEFFMPNGITSLKIDQSNDILNEVTYYDRWNVDRGRAVASPAVNNSCKFGGGGFVGKASDLVKLQLLMLNNRISRQDFTNRYYKGFETNDGEPINYAFGLGDRVSESGVRYNAHTGSGRGANTAQLIYPEAKLVVVLLGNRESNIMNQKIGEIAKPFLELIK